MAKAGLAVLTSSGTVLNRGYTTGTTAAACCKAAILSLEEEIREVEVPTPSGIRVCVPVEASGVWHHAGNTPGTTLRTQPPGSSLLPTCTPADDGISLYPGEGIGRFSRDTPRYRKGEPAISTPALSSILAAVHEGLNRTGLSGITVHLRIPDGLVVAGKTLNPQIGIEGGISVLGTTGLVEPWDDHLTETVMERVRTSDRVVLTTGRTGLRYARLLFPDHDVVLAGSHLEVAIAEARGPVVLCGLPALILRFLDPDLPGHNRICDHRRILRSAGIQRQDVRRIPEGEGAIPGIADRDSSTVTAPSWEIQDESCRGRLRTRDCSPSRPSLAISGATVIFGSKRAIALAAAHIPRGCTVKEMTTFRPELPIPDDAVVLSTGDPQLAGLGYLGGEIIPGISSLQVAAARLGIPLEQVIGGCRPWQRA